MDLSIIIYTADFSVREKTAFEIEFMDDDLAFLSSKKDQFKNLLKATRLTVENYLNRSKFDIHELVRPRKQRRH